MNPYRSCSSPRTLSLQYVICRDSSISRARCEAVWPRLGTRASHRAARLFQQPANASEPERRGSLSAVVRSAVEANDGGKLVRPAWASWTLPCRCTWCVQSRRASHGDAVTSQPVPAVGSDKACRQLDVRLGQGRQASAGTMSALSTFKSTASTFSFWQKAMHCGSPSQRSHLNATWRLGCSWMTSVGHTS